MNAALRLLANIELSLKDGGSVLTSRAAALSEIETLCRIVSSERDAIVGAGGADSVRLEEELFTAKDSLRIFCSQLSQISSDIRP